MQSELQSTRTQTAPFWVSALLLIAVVLLGAGYIFKLLTPTRIDAQPTINTNYEGGTTKFSGVTFTGQAIALPKKLPTATIEKINTQFTNFEQVIVKNYALSPVSEIPNLWTNDSYSLEKAPSINQYIFTKLSPPIEKIVTDPVKATVVAKQLVDGLLPNNNLQVLENKITYHLADAHGDVVNPDQAQLVDIPFGYQILGVPVYFDQQVGVPVTVTINSDYEVQRAVFQPFTGDIKAGSEIQTISIEQALKNINESHGTIIASASRTFENPVLSTISSGSLHSVTLEYRFSPSTNIIIPYYSFSGELVDSAGNTFTATIITPAIQTKFD